MYDDLISDYSILVCAVGMQYSTGTQRTESYNLNQ